MTIRYQPARRGLAVLALVCLLSGAASAQGIPGGPAGPVAVGVIELQRQPVPRVITIPGRAVAHEQTEIRPRVSGMVTQIAYQAGQHVEEGDLLFQLDALSYEAELTRAEAAVSRAEAALALAQSALARAEQLEGSGVTRASVENAQATRDQSQADLQAAEAALRLAEMQLSWTGIRSPIEGIADVPQVSVGDLVSSGQAQALTTVTRFDPIEVELLEPSSRLLSVRNQIESGALRPEESLQVTLTLEDGSTYNGAGTLITPGFQVSRSTGTVAMRFRFANPEMQILPGMFLRGDLHLGVIDAFLVPQRATSRGRDGALMAWVVGEGDVAEERVLTAAGSYRNGWVVTAGLEEGERLMVDGTENLRAGAEVAPVAVTIDTSGVVRDADAPAPSDTAE